MAVGTAQRFGQRGGVGASHRAAVSYGMPIASRAYGTAMVRPGTGVNATPMVSTSTMSKGGAVATSVQTTLTNAITAANAGKAATAVAAVLSARTYATSYATTLGTAYPAVMQQIDAADMQVQQINAAMAAAAAASTGAAGYPSAAPDDMVDLEALAPIEEEKSNTGTWIAVGILTVSVLAAGGLLFTGKQSKRRSNGRRSRR